MNCKDLNNKGFTLVEIIVAIGLAAIFLPAIGTILSLSLQSSIQGEKFAQGNALAQETMEAVFSLKEDGDNWDWISSPANTPPNMYYQPSHSGGIWTLGSQTSTPAETPDSFTRTVEINEVRRCGDDICLDPTAPVDDDSREIIVTVSWPEKGTTQEVKLNAYVTKH